MNARGRSRVSVRPTTFCASARDPHGSLAWQWARVHRAARLHRQASSVVALTLTIPMTILSFVAVFAGFGLGSSPNYLAAGVLVTGVFIGSALWWLLLSGGVGLLQSRIGSGLMQLINRLSGCIIFAFGIYSLSTSWSV